MLSHEDAHGASLLGAVSSAASSSSTAPPSRAPEQSEFPLEATPELEPSTPSIPAGNKHPLSVVDSEELKRKGHGLSLLATDEREPLPGTPSAPRTAPKPPSFCMRSLLASPLCHMRTRAPLSRTLTPSLSRIHRRAKSRPGVASGREEYRRLRLAEALALRAADDLRLCNRRPQSRLRSGA